MTAVELKDLNVQIWRDMGVLADSEAMMKRVAKYLRKLVKEKKDPTLMTRERAACGQEAKTENQDRHASIH